MRIKIKKCTKADNVTIPETIYLIYYNRTGLPTIACNDVYDMCQGALFI